MARAPVNVMRIAMTHANTGRSMKKCDMTYLPLRGGRHRGSRGCGPAVRCAACGHGLRRRTRLRLLQSRHDDLVAVLEPAREDPVVAHDAHGLDARQSNLSVLADDEHVRTLAVALHRQLRHAI